MNVWMPTYGLAWAPSSLPDALIATIICSQGGGQQAPRAGKTHEQHSKRRTLSLSLQQEKKLCKNAFLQGGHAAAVPLDCPQVETRHLVSDDMGNFMASFVCPPTASGAAIPSFPDGLVRVAGIGSSLFRLNCEAVV